jgi:hypothetical protein
MILKEPSFKMILKEPSFKMILKDRNKLTIAGQWRGL